MIMRPKAFSYELSYHIYTHTKIVNSDPSELKTKQA